MGKGKKRPRTSLPPKANSSNNNQDECNAPNDLISKLPYEILSSILSHLTLREAVRTSILSKRWRHAWISVPKLKFDAINIAGVGCDACNFRKDNQYKFVRCVNQVLQLHQSRILEFKLQCCLGPEYSSEIDKWLQLAVNKALQNLDIDLSQPNSHPSLPDENCYSIPSSVFDGRVSSLKHLSLANCRFEVPSSTTCFSSLASLSLTSLYLSQDHINILCGCPNLQSLSLLCCNFPSLLRLTSRHRFLPLKHFNINRCRYLAALEIFDAVGLLSFECVGTLLRQLTLQNTAKPVRISYGLLVCEWRVEAAFYDFDRLVADFPQVEKLALILPRIEENEMRLRLPTLDRLQELVLDMTIQYASDILKFISSLLKASPYLRKLQVAQPLYTKIPLRESTWLVEAPKGCCSVHEHLREVNLYKFDGKPSELELLRFLLQNTSALEKLLIFCSSRSYRGNDQWEKVAPTYVNKTRLCEKLKEFVSSNNLGSNSIQLLVY